MQYKIPVQIETADRIIFWLSLKQLAILLVWGWIAYQVWQSLTQKFWLEVSLIPTWFIVVLTLLIVFFKRAQMTFLPFILSAIRYNVNLKERMFVKGIDSFQPIDIGFVASSTWKKEKDIDFDSKIDKITKLEDQLKKI